MLNKILFKALLKISKENRDNNYIYSDIYFPKTLIKQKEKNEKKRQMLYKNIFQFDKLNIWKKSKTLKVKGSKGLYNKKPRNRENKSGLMRKLSFFSKTGFNALSPLPKVRSQKNNNTISIDNLKEKFGTQNFKGTQYNSLNITPKRKSFLFDENTLKKIREIKKNNNFDFNGVFNFHILKINAPKEKIKKSLSNISPEIFNLKNFSETFFEKNLFKLKKLKIEAKNKDGQIQIVSKDTNENEKSSKVQNKYIKNIDSKKNFNSTTKELKNEKNILSISFPKYKSKKNYPHKFFPMIQINNFREKYLSIFEIDNNISNKKEEHPFSLKLYKNLTLENDNDLYYYTINKMYSNQIREYMSHRINWENFYDYSYEDKNLTINFSWRYFSNRINYKKYQYNIESIQNNPSNIKKLRMINLFERNYEVGNKKYMFLNLINYCDKNNINVFDIVPFTVIINNSPDVELALEALKDIISFTNKNKSNETNMITNRKYNEHFYFDKNYENINKQYININKNFLSDKNYWIIKPADLYQGKCIDIFSEFKEIYKQCKNIFRGVNTRILPESNQKEEDEPDNYFNEFNENDTSNFLSSNYFNDEINNNFNKINKKRTFYSKMYCSNEIIIQKYLDNPLLYNQRKFDIRCFVLIDYNLNLFFFREGHLKACSELYNLDDRNRFIHITNYSLQKKSIKFETYEEGNEISYSDFKKFLISQNIPLTNFDNMISQMKILVEISMKSVGKKLLRTNPVLSFEIFGYDFIIDNEFKPWILEINNNPGLAISSPVIEKIIPRMMDDAFRLTIDKVFNTKYDFSYKDNEWKYKSKYKIEGFSDDENVFEYLCNIK